MSCSKKIVYLDQYLGAAQTKPWSESPIQCFLHIFYAKVMKNEVKLFWGLFPNSGWPKNAGPAPNKLVKSRFCAEQHLGKGKILLIFASKSCKNVWKKWKKWKKDILTSVFLGQHSHAGENIQQWLSTRVVVHI